MKKKNNNYYNELILVTIYNILYLLVCNSTNYSEEVKKEFNKLSTLMELKGIRKW